MAQLTDLDDDCLLMVLDRLPAKELFKMQRVNIRMQRLATGKMRTKIQAISFTNDFRASECNSHFGYTILEDQVLFLEPMFNWTPVADRYVRNVLQSPSKTAVFLRLLTKCPCVKSIDFHQVYTSLPGDLLLEVVRRCSQLECIKLGKLNVCWTVKEDLDGMEMVLDEIGDKIRHFVKEGSSNDTAKAEVRLLKMVAEKCPDVKRVDWQVNWRVQSCFDWRDFGSALKMLPDSCWIRLNCGCLNGPVFEDVDELSIPINFDWSLLASARRLSKLDLAGFYLTDRRISGVVFANLKKFNLSNVAGYFKESVHCLFASRFPLLEEFCFNAMDFTQDDYQVLFRRMSSLKKLTIYWDGRKEGKRNLPELAIHELKNLDTFKLDITNNLDNGPPETIFQQLEHYVDGIISLKKLTVEMLCHGFDWEKTVIDEVKRLKLKQERVELVLDYEEPVTTFIEKRK